MGDVIDSRQKRAKAAELRKSGNHAAALPLFNELWASDDRTLWDGWGAAYCLRKLGEAKEAARICREVERVDDSFGPAYGLHAWCLYDAYIKEPSLSDPRLLDVLRSVAKAAEKSGDRYARHSALVPAVFRVVRYFKDPYRPGPTLAAIEMLDSSELSTEFESIEVRGKNQRILSRRERYFHARTKALFELARWQECAAACIEALEMVPRFRGEGLTWIERRLALSILNTGDAHHAAALMTDVLKRKNEWFIHDDLAQALLALERYADARQHLVQALMMNGPEQMKVGTLLRMAKLEERLGNTESACAHAMLSLRIRADQGWNEDEETSALVNAMGCQDAPRDQPAGVRDLRRYWSESTAAGS